MADVQVRPTGVYLYADPSAAPDLRTVAAHITRVCGIPARVREEFLVHHKVRDLDGLARELAAARVSDLAHPLPVTELPLPLVLFERRQLGSPERRVSGVLYDGIRMQRILRTVLPPKERSLAFAHIVFTSRLLGTFDDADRRYHARAIVVGYPSLISTSGLVEAPAKPREFYVAKRALRIETADARYESLKANYAERFLDFEDRRLTQVAKGYALQALFYHATGEPFCEDRGCVLFNAHWQEELLHAQVESGLLCARHRKVAEALRGGRRTRTRLSRRREGAGRPRTNSSPHPSRSPPRLKRRG
jgi:hypothetical protein